MEKQEESKPFYVEPRVENLSQPQPKQTWVFGLPDASKTKKASRPTIASTWPASVSTAKGVGDRANAAKNGDMVTVCNTDKNCLGLASKISYPKAKTYTDFRKMISTRWGGEYR